MALRPCRTGFTISSLRNASAANDNLFSLFSISSSSSSSSSSPAKRNLLFSSLRDNLRRFASSASLYRQHLRQQQQQQQQQQSRVKSLDKSETLAQKIGKSIRRAGAPSKARVYSDVNVVRPKDYWDYESLAVQWGYIYIYYLPFHLFFGFFYFIFFSLINLTTSIS